MLLKLRLTIIIVMHSNGAYTNIACGLVSCSVSRLKFTQVLLTQNLDQLILIK